MEYLLFAQFLRVFTCSKDAIIASNLVLKKNKIRIITWLLRPTACAVSINLGQSHACSHRWLQDEPHVTNPNYSAKQRDDARRLSLQLLDKIRNGAALDDVVEMLARHDQPIPKSYVRHILMGAMRQSGQLARMLNRHLSKPFDKASSDIQDIFLLASFDILNTTAPKPSVAHAWVETSKTIGNLKRAANLLNAVLRKVVAETPEELPNPIHNLPFWLRKRLIADWGQPRMEKIAAMLLEVPPTDLRLMKGQENPAKDAHVVTDQLIRLADASIDVRDLKGFDEGGFIVQNLAAGLPVDLGLALHPKAKTAIDLCAAPGGKTIQLLDHGLEVTAVDYNTRRLTKLEQNLTRLGLDARTIRADVLQLQQNTDESYDVVLLDAPCTATGTIRRHPDLLIQKHESQLEELVEIQKKMLDRACQLLAPGGILIYAVCSLFKMEGEDQAKSFLERHEDFEFVAPTLPLWLGDKEAIETHEGVRILPDHLLEHGGMDGFFMGFFKRKKR